MRSLLSFERALDRLLPARAERRAALTHYEDAARAYADAALCDRDGTHDIGAQLDALAAAERTLVRRGFAPIGIGALLRDGYTTPRRRGLFARAEFPATKERERSAIYSLRETGHQLGNAERELRATLENLERGVAAMRMTAAALQTANTRQQDAMTQLDAVAQRLPAANASLAAALERLERAATKFRATAAGASPAQTQKPDYKN